MRGKETEEWLTVAELSELTKSSKGAIYKAINDKKIPGVDIPGIGYRVPTSFLNNLDRSYDPLSPYERKRLEREIENLKHECDELKGVLAEILAASSKVIKKM